MSDPNENRAGYKETKVGWIPLEWKCAPLKELGGFLKGAGITKSQLTSHGVPAVRYGDIYTTHNIVVQKFVSFVDKQTSEQATPLHCGDIVFASSGETAKEIGKCAAVLSRTKCVAGGDTIVFRPSSGDSHWFAAFLNSNSPRRELLRVAQGQSVVHVYESNLRELFVAVPSELEQEEVAAILVDWDKAICQIAELITAKRKEKKALMQQLLTGKKRLPGFEHSKETTPTRTGEIPSDWKWTHLGEAFKKRVERSGNVLPLMAITIDSGMVRRDSIERRVDSKLTESDNLLARKGDIAYNTMRMWQGAVGVAEEDCHVSPAYVVCPPEAAVADSEFYYYWFKSAEGLHLLWSYSYGITGDRLRLYAADFSLVPAPLPSLEEQKAIVAVLKAAEAEIDQLDQKQSALKQQKKALMQKLLTGQVRVKV